jgi:hypothetical protein
MNGEFDLNLVLSREAQCIFRAICAVCPGNRLSVHSLPVWRTIDLDNDQSVDLVRVKLTEFGFQSFAKLMDVYQRSLVYGLKLCDEETVQKLREQYTTESNTETLFIIMSIGSSENGVFKLDCVSNGQIFKPDTAVVHPNSIWTSEWTFLFTRPRVE